MEKALAALSVCEGGPRTTLTCQKKKIIIIQVQKNYINNYFILICSVTTKNCIYIL